MCSILVGTILTCCIAPGTLYVYACTLLDSCLPVNRYLVRTRRLFSRISPGAIHKSAWAMRTNRNKLWIVQINNTRGIKSSAGIIDLALSICGIMLIILPYICLKTCHVSSVFASFTWENKMNVWWGDYGTESRELSLRRYNDVGGISHLAKEVLIFDLDAHQRDPHASTTLYVIWGWNRQQSPW